MPRERRTSASLLAALKRPGCAVGITDTTYKLLYSGAPIERKLRPDDERHKGKGSQRTTRPNVIPWWTAKHLEDRMPPACFVEGNERARATQQRTGRIARAMDREDAQQKRQANAVNRIKEWQNAYARGENAGAFPTINLANFVPKKRTVPGNRVRARPRGLHANILKARYPGINNEEFRYNLNALSRAEANDRAAGRLAGQANIGRKGTRAESAAQTRAIRATGLDGRRRTPSGLDWYRQAPPNEQRAYTQMLRQFNNMNALFTPNEQQQIVRAVDRVVEPYKMKWNAGGLFNNLSPGEQMNINTNYDILTTNNATRDQSRKAKRTPTKAKRTPMATNKKNKKPIATKAKPKINKKLDTYVTKAFRNLRLTPEERGIARNLKQAEYSNEDIRNALRPNNGTLLTVPNRGQFNTNIGILRRT